MNYQLPTPAGFGNCGKCAYFASGPPQVCQQCAAATLEPAAPFYCSVCGQRIATTQASCTNRLCSDPDRQFEFNHAIAMKTGQLDRAIKSHKYDQRWGWGIIFARVLLGHLARDPATADADLIIPMPALPLPAGTPSRREIDHSGWVVESAAAQDDVGYPFRADPPVIVKTRTTARMASTTGYGERLAVSNDIYDALQVLDPDAVTGATVVVVDDVFTTGNTLNAVARRLREAGADTVRGITLARQPWG
ncbi:phosphoribosyltransferase [Saccharothrix sp. NRRL B-16348]|uniref:ComF family protein n=1 Tax=Saccharothrix sp. NRRL B-16348 TaxID=1415542 RepID=UPI0006AF4565|nr:phosphoribosyltransferase family protein [Saccharothrix sp. NRRL B-16348]KOX13544.1 phosphoribosyltransferase [Saccharothrix sp. NRRL B-16348]